MLRKNLDKFFFINTAQLNELIDILSNAALQKVLEKFNKNQVILLYYRLNMQNRSKIFYNSSHVRSIINEAEKESFYLSKVETALIFQENTNYKTIIEVLSTANTHGYHKDYVVFVDKHFKLKGVVNVSDIFIAYKLNSSVDLNIINTHSISYDEEHSLTNKSVSTNMLIDMHKTILVDRHDYVIGVVNIDYITRDHDLFYLSNKRMYAIQRKDMHYVTIVVLSNFAGTAISAISSMIFDLHIVNVVLVMFTKCITDSITLLLVENRIHYQLLFRYISTLILFSCTITSLAISLIQRNYFSLIYVFCTMFLVLYFVYFVIMFTYKKSSNVSIFIILLIPEIIITTCLVFADKALFLF